MKYKWIGIAMTIGMIGAGMLAGMAEPQQTEVNRIHQHQIARKDTGCTCKKQELCSHLPLVLLDTEGTEIPGSPTDKKDRFGERIYETTKDGKKFLESKISVVDHPDSNNHPSDAPTFTTLTDCRIRGHVSRHYAKKSYLLKFRNSDQTDNEVEVMGMEAHNEWILYGPFQDASMLRNYMWYNIAGELMDYAPNVRFCELMLNGEYQGLYLMAESITDGRGCRLNLRDRIKGSEVYGYLLRLDRPTEIDLEMARDLYTYGERIGHLKGDMAVRYPGANKLTEELAKEIELDFSQFEKSLYSYDYDTERYGYWNWIDVDNFVDYFLINEFTGNMDAGKYSTFIYKEVGGKYKMVVWDFNDACNNSMDVVLGTDTFYMVSKSLYFMLCKDDMFIQRVLDRYQELRKTYFSDAYIENYIAETTAYLGPAIARNSALWQEPMAEWSANGKVQKDIRSQEVAAEELKCWLVERGAWLDENIDSLKAYSHFSSHKEYDH